MEPGTRGLLLLHQRLIIHMTL
eukprot:COSAG01_NODE_55356_length_325_cov_1.747788_1_plen_21_part_10